MWDSFKNLSLIIFLLWFTSFSSLADQNIPEEILKIEDSLLYEIAVTKNDSLKVEILYILSDNFYNYNNLKGLKYIDQSIKLAEEINIQCGLIRGYYSKAYHLYYMRDFDKSMQAIFKVDSLNKEFGSDKLSAGSNSLKGMIYGRLNETDKALTYIKNAHKYYTKLNNNIGIGSAFNNMGMIFLKNNELDSALYYFDRSIASYPSDRYGAILNSYINIIQIFLKDERLDLASEKLSIAFSMKDKIDNPDILGELYYINGCYLMVVHNENDAIYYLKKSINTCKEKQIWEVIISSAEKLIEIYRLKEDYKNAFIYNELFRQANDSLNLIQARENIAKLEMKNNYNLFLLEQQIRERKKDFKYLLYSTIFLIIFLFAIGFYYWQKKNIKFRLKEFEMKQILFDSELKNSSLEKISLKDELKFKNNELMNFALQLVQKNDFIKNIMLKIKKLKTNLTKEENIKQIDDVTLYINHSLDINRARKEFHLNIEMLNKAFYDNLTQKFPTISKNEKRLALLLRLNFSSKKIATLLNVSIHTVDSSRHRLRKKLGIDTKTNLSEFFNSI